MDDAIGVSLLRYRHLDLFMGALFERKLTTLAELSARRGRCDDDSPLPRKASRRSIQDAQEHVGSSFTARPGEGLMLPARLLTSSSSSTPAAADRDDPAADSAAGRPQAGPVAGRCFKRAHLCRLKARDEDALVAAAHSLSRHYDADIRQAAEAVGLPDPWPVRGGGGSGYKTDSAQGGYGSGSGSGAAMHVVFATRPSTDARSLLNEAELLAECNAWAPAPDDGGDTRGGRRIAESGASGLGAMPQGTGPGGGGALKVGAGEGNADDERPSHAVGRRRVRSLLDASSAVDSTTDDNSSPAWGSATCVTRAFGSSAAAGGMLADIGFMSGADVLVCLHGAACLNAYFMGNGSSLVRVRCLPGGGMSQ